MKRGGIKRLHYKKQHRVVKTGYLLLALPLTVLSSAYFLRKNNLEMVSLRSQVIAADKSGENLRKSIEALNKHIFNHMNTTTVRPVELVYTYNRQAQAVIKAATPASSSNVYQEAAAACEQRGIPLTSIAECAAEYALSNNKNVNPKKVELPDKNLFIYSFVSPKWTPDMAGWSIVLTVVIMLWLIIRFLEFVAVRLVVRSHLKKSNFSNNS